VSAKRQTLEEYLAAGGKIEKLPTPKHKPGTTSRYKLADVGKGKPSREPGEYQILVSMLKLAKR